ncbi:MAG: TolC family protein [Rhodoferax sp.]|nr:TolC family protein [Rhodoferax sp.]
MNPLRPRLSARGYSILVASMLALSGCATLDFDASLARTNQDTTGFTQGGLVLAQTAAHREARAQEAARLLAQPLDQAGAVQLALANSPALQALLAQSWSELALLAQSGRMANPSLSLEQASLGAEFEIGRRLSLGLLDLLTLPQRQERAQHAQELAQIRLSAQVVEQVTQVRQAWVRAVATQQSLVYAQQVNTVAHSSAELARRMQAVGNFNLLQRARQHAFYAEASGQWALAQHAALVAREALVRALGLDDAQALQLRLPERLPALPQAPREPMDLAPGALAQRLDVRLAQAALAASLQAQGLNTLESLTDVELGVRRDTVFDNAAGAQASRQGVEIAVRLPLLDRGELRRTAQSAQTLALAQRVQATLREASSGLRESYSAYRSAYDLARHYRDEVLPLRKTIADENLLRYNGMLIGVFELLADTKEQIAGVQSAIAAEEQFWLADAALQAAQVGRPTTASPRLSASPMAPAAGAAAH